MVHQLPQSYIQYLHYSGPLYNTTQLYFHKTRHSLTYRQVMGCLSWAQRSLFYLQLPCCPWYFIITDCAIIKIIYTCWHILSSSNGLQRVDSNWLYQYSSDADMATRALSQYKVSFSRYGDLHYIDKMAMRLFYHYNWNPYPGKMTSLCWENHQVHIQLYSYFASKSPHMSCHTFYSCFSFLSFLFNLVTTILLKKHKKTCTKVEMSSLWHFHHWLYWKLSF